MPAALLTQGSAGPQPGLLHTRASLPLPRALRMQRLLGVSGASAYSTSSGASSPMKARQLSSFFSIECGASISSPSTCEGRHNQAGGRAACRRACWHELGRPRATSS